MPASFNGAKRVAWNRFCHNYKKSAFNHRSVEACMNWVKSVDRSARYFFFRQEGNYHCSPCPSTYNGGNAKTGVQNSHIYTYEIIGGGSSTTTTTTTTTGTAYYVSRVRIRNRRDCCGQRLAYSSVRIIFNGRERQCGRLPGRTQNGRWYTVTCRGRIVGDGIKIVTTRNEYLSIAGIEVWGFRATHIRPPRPGPGRPGPGRPRPRPTPRPGPGGKPPKVTPTRPGPGVRPPRPGPRPGPKPGPKPPKPPIGGGGMGGHTGITISIRVTKWRFKTGEILRQGSCLVSKNNQYKACLQVDGNFIVTMRNTATLESRWKKITGSAINIDVDFSGNAFVQNKHGAMYKWNGSRWNKIYGKANDVAVCSEGTMWHVGSNREAGGHGIWRMTAGSKKWRKIPGSGVRIACGADGNALVVNKQKNIYQYTGRGWKQIRGKANDIAIGHDGTVWVIGNNTEGGGFGIYKNVGGKWKKIPGSAVRISVDPVGNAWVVNKHDRIYQHDGRRWKLESGRAKDIGVGGNGNVWVIGTNREGGGFGIYMRAMKVTSKWERINGAATDISVDGSGLAWAINKSQYIFRFNGKRWKRYPGRARDIAVSPSGRAWIIGSNVEGGGYGIYRWSGNSNLDCCDKLKGIKRAGDELDKDRKGRWEKISGSAVRIAVGPDGNAWVVNKQKKIFQYTGGRWKMLPGSAMDIGVGANGQMWVIGTNTEGGGYGIYRWTGRKYNKIAGSATRVSVDKDGNAWVVNKHRQIYYYNGSRWLRQPGAAYDIGCGAEGTHWVVGTNALARGGYGVYRKATGASRTVFSTNSQGALNWKRGVKWTMSFRYNSVVIMGNNVQAWSTGRFPCTNMMTLTNEGNLQASCNGKKITW